MTVLQPPQNLVKDDKLCGYLVGLWLFSWLLLMDQFAVQLWLGFQLVASGIWLWHLGSWLWHLAFSLAWQSCSSGSALPAWLLALASWLLALALGSWFTVGLTLAGWLFPSGSACCLSRGFGRLILLLVPSDSEALLGLSGGSEAGLVVD